VYLRWEKWNEVKEKFMLGDPWEYIHNLPRQDITTESDNLHILYESAHTLKSRGTVSKTIPHSFLVVFPAFRLNFSFFFVHFYGYEAFNFIHLFKKLIAHFYYWNVSSLILIYTLSILFSLLNFVLLFITLLVFFVTY